MHHITTTSLAPCLHFIDRRPGIFIIFSDDTQIDAAGKDKFEKLLNCFLDVIEHTCQGNDENDKL